MFQGIQAVALPMVQEFGYTREIEDRVLAPLPIALVAVEKIVCGALQRPVRRRCSCSRSPPSCRPPPVHLDINWPVLLTLAPLACYMCGALGLTFGTRFDPRTVPLLFGIIVIPLTFLGCIYYPWQSLEPIRWLQIARAREPARVHVRGVPGRAHRRRAPHEPVGRVRRAHRLLGVFTWLGVERLQAPRSSPDGGPPAAVS